ncbi:MAG: endonuclease/exonuclease/phosphatase family protein [Planctomycetota bacterium]
MRLIRRVVRWCLGPGPAALGLLGQTLTGWALAGQARAQEPEPEPGWLHPLAQQPFGAWRSMTFPSAANGAPWDFAAQPLTLVRWWTTGCPFCRDSLPALAQLEATHRARGLRLLPVFHPKGVRPDDAALAEYLRELGVQGPFAVDADWSVLQDILQRGELTSATSISVLVDRHGRIRWVHPGPRLCDDPEHPEARAALAELDDLLDRLLPRADAPPVELTVMGFNVRYGTADDGDDAWPRRKALLLETITRDLPDVLATQELLPEQGEAIERELDAALAGEGSGYVRVGRSRSARDDDEQCAILLRENRLEVRDRGHFMLSATPDAHGSADPDAALPRLCTWVRASDRRNGRELLLASTHFDHRGAAARRRAWGVLQRELGRHARGAPIVLLGDFNVDLDADAARERAPRAACLDGLGLVDAFAGRDVGGTFHGFRGEPGAARIDGVFAHRDLEVRDAGLDRHHDGARWPSDHFPVRARLRW